MHFHTFPWKKSSKNKHLPHLMTHFEYVASKLLGGSALSFHTTLVLTALGTWTAQNAMSGQGKPKKVKLRLVSQPNRGNEKKEEGRKSQSRLLGEGDLTMSIHSIQHDYLDFRLKKAEEAGIQQFCVKTMKRLFKGTCQKRLQDLLL